MKAYQKKYYTQLFEVMKEPLPGTVYLAGDNSKTTHQIQNQYNTKYNTDESISSIAGALKHLERHGIVRKRQRYDGALWWLVKGADIEDVLK